MAYKSEEQKRGCGWRGAGGLYAVGCGAVVGGTVTVACRFVRLDPIPFTKEAKNPGRGFIYVDGEAILEGKPPYLWDLSPERANVFRLMWTMWGLHYMERHNAGVCEGAFESSVIHSLLCKLKWAEGSAEAWPDQAQDLIGAVRALRQQHGDCPLVPAIMESRKLRWCGPIVNMPMKTLSRCWRLLTELSWIGPIPAVVFDTISKIMKALGAEADVPLLEEYFNVQSEEESHGTEEGNL